MLLVKLTTGIFENEIVDTKSQTIARCFSLNYGSFGWCGTCDETAKKGIHILA